MVYVTPAKEELLLDICRLLDEAVGNELDVLNEQLAHLEEELNTHEYGTV